jgi:hypothetical protein
VIKKFFLTAIFSQKIGENRNSWSQDWLRTEKFTGAKFLPSPLAKKLTSGTYPQNFRQFSLNHCYEQYFAQTESVLCKKAPVKFLREYFSDSSDWLQHWGTCPEVGSLTGSLMRMDMIGSRKWSRVDFINQFRSKNAGEILHGSNIKLKCVK